MMPPTTTYDFYAGAILLVDKPLHWTSFDVVNKLRHTIRHRFGKKLKVGHAGTLDPLATGLVVIATGTFTKNLATLTGEDKIYEAIIGLGKTSPSYDQETPLEPGRDPQHLTQDHIEQALSYFRGDIWQKPPMYSALKKDGKPLYKAARKGVFVELQPRPVSIREITITHWQPPLLHCTIACSKGTYIRSVANDLGEKLSVGGYLHALRRTQSGSFQVEDAKSVDEWVHLIQQQSAP